MGENVSHKISKYMRSLDKIVPKKKCWEKERTRRVSVLSRDGMHARNAVLEAGKCKEIDSPQAAGRRLWKVWAP